MKYLALPILRQFWYDCIILIDYYATHRLSAYDPSKLTARDEKQLLALR